MFELYKDKAGNRLIKYIDGSYRAVNREGQTVGKKGFETLAKRAGMNPKHISSKSKNRHTYSI